MMYNLLFPMFTRKSKLLEGGKKDMSPLTDDQTKNTITLNMDFSGLDTVGDNISTELN